MGIIASKISAALRRRRHRRVCEQLRTVVLRLTLLEERAKTVVDGVEAEMQELAARATAQALAGNAAAALRTMKARQDTRAGNRQAYRTLTLMRQQRARHEAALSGMELMEVTGDLAVALGTTPATASRDVDAVVSRIGDASDVLRAYSDGADELADLLSKDAAVAEHDDELERDMRADGDADLQRELEQMVSAAQQQRRQRRHNDDDGNAGESPLLLASPHAATTQTPRALHAPRPVRPARNVDGLAALLSSSSSSPPSTPARRPPPVLA